MATAYVYNIRSKKAVAVISGKQESLDKWLDEHFQWEWDLEKFAVTHSPAFNFENGLRGVNSTAKHINLDEGR